MKTANPRRQFALRASYSVLCATAALLPPLAAASAFGAEPEAPAAKALFDGKSLEGWKVLDELDFKGHGKVEVRDGRILLGQGDPFTGIKWTGKPPRMGYELGLEAMRTGGDDFFCGLVFPVGKADCSLVVGGWGGTIVGLSNIDGEPAVENETSQGRDFKKDRWYAIRLRVTERKIEVWIDKEKMVDFAHADRKLTVRWDQEQMLPLGVCTWRTAGAVRNVTLRELGGGEKPEEPKP